MKKIILLFVVPLFFIISCKLDYEIYTNTNEISEIVNILFPRIIELENVLIKKQPTSSTCGITTVTIMSNYFNSTNHEASDLIKKYNVNSSRGSSRDDILRWLRGELPEKNIEYKSNGTSVEMIMNIHNLLNNNIPVPISFGSLNPYNKPFYDFHASVVYGINLDNETITIANTYGYIEKLTLIEFLNAMSFTEIDKYPLFQQTALLRNNMEKNGYFLIN